jgi:hypothetical protein
MVDEEFNKYVEGRYKEQVAWYDKNSILYKRLNYLFQIPTLFIASIIPVFAVLEEKWITVILSAIMAVFVGITNFCKFEEKWHSYRTTCETLKKEIYFYNSKIGEYQDADNPETLFIQRVESTISREHTQWLTIEKSKKKEEKRLR